MSPYLRIVDSEKVGPVLIVLDKAQHACTPFTPSSAIGRGVISEEDLHHSGGERLQREHDITLQRAS